MYQPYRRLAAELGLRLSTDPGMMTFSFDVSGELGGQPVKLTRTCGSGARVDITSPIPAHLDLGLGVTRVGVLSRVADWFGSHDIQLGDPHVDAGFDIRGDEPERVRALLSSEVRAAMTAITTADLEVTDAAVSTGHSVGVGGHESFEALAHELHSAARLAQGVGAAARQVPPAQPLRGHAEAWSAFARQRGLSGGTTPLWMQGKLARAWVAARGLRNEANDFSLELSARLDPPATIGVAVDPRDGDGPLFGRKPEPTGDAAFDAAFVVTRSDRPDLVDEEVRGRIVDLGQLGTVWLRGAEVTLRTPARLEPTRVAGILDDLIALLEALARRAQPPPSAYR
jgi:hypothetical protein